MLAIIIVLLVMAIIILSCSSEGFMRGPPANIQKELVEYALQNPHLFDPKKGSYSAAKKVIGGLDTITYEDFRGKYIDGKFNAIELFSAFK